MFVRPSLSLLIVILLSLTACGGGGGGGDNGNLSSNPDPEQPSPIETVEVLRNFEGMSLVLNSEIVSSEVQWQQLGGTPLEIEDTTSSEADIVLPWITEESVVAELQASATVNGQLITKRFELTILDRRYIVLDVRDQGAGSNDLFLRYISANDTDGVPTPNTIQLTSLTAGQRVCGYTISPNGQYLAYSINQTPELVVTTCRGVYIVDIDSQIQQNISKLSVDDQQIIVRSPLKWSPDGLQLTYKGDHGEGITQIYVISIENATTSYINYGNNSLMLANWPSEDLFPVDDGGNVDGLSLVDDLLGFDFFWLKNSEGLSFSVMGTESSDLYQYQASVHGDTRKMERPVNTLEHVFSLDTEAIADYNESLANCPTGGTCAALPLLPIPLIVNNRSLTNPRKAGSSVDGYLMTVATMLTNEASPITVLAVRNPVVDDGSAGLLTPIEASYVYDAEWSPVGNHLAFAAGNDIRHRHTEDDVPLHQLIGYEIPGQLYLYQDYQPAHAEAQERLANPQPAIDSSFVRAIKWSDDGNYIAYARGESGIEGAYYTSLWVTFVDTVRDESSSTIDANTTLLANLVGSDNYATDFMWSTDSNTLVMMLQTEDGPLLRFVNRDGSVSFDSPILTGFVSDWLEYIQASFSPDGQHFVYFNQEQSGGEAIAAIYIQPVAGGDRVRINVDLQDNQTIPNRPILWSPHGNAVIYAVSTSGVGYSYYLAQIDGTSQSLGEFFLPTETISNIVVK